MKTKFIDIPKEKRKDIWNVAMDAFYKLERHTFDVRRVRYNDKATPPHYIYKLTQYHHLKLYGSSDQIDRIEFIHKDKEGSVMFVVTNHEWPRKLFFELMKAENATAHEQGEKAFLKKLDDDMFKTAN